MVLSADRSATRSVRSWSGVASWLICRTNVAAIAWDPWGIANRQIERTTNGSPLNRPAESFGRAEASRITAAVSARESLCDNEPIESIPTGATTPPMNPTFHGRGGGAALSVATRQAPASDDGMSGSSAVCTVPFRPNSVIDAGCGIPASPADVFPLSGASMKARVGTSVATSKTGPALTSHAGADGTTVADSAETLCVCAPVSVREGALARSQAPTRRTARIGTERNSFILRNLDRRTPPSTATMLEPLRHATYPLFSRTRLACVGRFAMSPFGATSWHIPSTPFRLY